MCWEGLWALTGIELFGSRMLRQGLWVCSPERQHSMWIIFWGVHLLVHAVEEVPTSVKSMPQPSDVMKRTVLTCSNVMPSRNNPAKPTSLLERWKGAFGIDSRLGCTQCPDLFGSRIANYAGLQQGVSTIALPLWVWLRFEQDFCRCMSMWLKSSVHPARVCHSHQTVSKCLAAGLQLTLQGFGVPPLGTGGWRCCSLVFGIPTWQTWWQDVWWQACHISPTERLHVDTADWLKMRACIGVPRWQQRKWSELTLSSICTCRANQHSDLVLDRKCCYGLRRVGGGHWWRQRRSWQQEDKMDALPFFKLEACSNWSQLARTWVSPPSLVVLPGNLSPCLDSCLWVYDSSCCIAGFLVSEICSCPTAWVQRLLISERFRLLILKPEVGHFSQFMLQPVVKHDAVRQILNIPNSSCQIQSGEQRFEPETGSGPFMSGLHVRKETWRLDVEKAA